MEKHHEHHKAEEGHGHMHPDHHHKAIKHHMAALHKMAKDGHKHHAKAPHKAHHAKKK